MARVGVGIGAMGLFRAGAGIGLWSYALPGAVVASVEGSAAAYFKVAGRQGASRCRRLLLKVLNRLGQRGEAVDPPGGFVHAFQTQHVAHGRARFDETE